MSLVSGELFNPEARVYLVRDFTKTMKHIMVGALCNGLALVIAVHSGWSKLYHSDDLSVVWAPMSIVLGLMVTDMIFYTLHRVVHLPPVYRYVHRYHHQSTPATTYATLSLDLIDYIIEGPISAFGPCYLIPMNFWAFYVTVIVNLFWGCYIHNYGRHNLGSVLSSSHKHQIHHAYGVQNWNFGYYTCLWDHLCGTYRDELK